MIYIVTFFHILVSVVLILVVLLQTGKRADLAGAFGGGGSQTAFGARGAATFLGKATTIAAVVFMLTSLGLSLLSSRSSAVTGTVLDETAPPASSAPAQTAPQQVPVPFEPGAPGEQPAEAPAEQPAGSPAGEATPPSPEAP